MRAAKKTDSRDGRDITLPSAQAEPGDDWTWMVAEDPAFSIEELGGAPGRDGM